MKSVYRSARTCASLCALVGGLAFASNSQAVPVTNSPSYLGVGAANNGPKSYVKVPFESELASGNHSSFRRSAHRRNLADHVDTQAYNSESYRPDPASMVMLSLLVTAAGLWFRREKFPSYRPGRFESS